MESAASRARAIISDRVSVPTLPTTLASVYQILDSPDAGAEEVAQIIAQDPAISAKVLRIANSAYYSPMEAITSIHRAVMTLGANSIRRLVVQASVLSCYEHLLECPDYDLRAFWLHSTRTATAARLLARHARNQLPGHPDEYYTTGLLQNVGALMMLDADAALFVTAQVQSKERGRGVIESERLLWETDHATVGAVFAEEWGLADCIRLSALHHHDESPGEDVLEITCLARLADHLAASLGSEDGGDASSDLLPALVAGLGLGGEEMDAISAEIQAEFAEIHMGDILG